MKYIPKLTSLLLVLSSSIFIGCDSATPLNFGGSSPTDITESDENVVDGELFRFEDVLFPETEQFLDTLRMTGANVAVLGDVVYNYASTGEFTSSITAEVPVGEAMEDATNQIFSVNNAANTEVRSLLAVSNASQDAPTLTDAELDRLIELLNVNGAGVVRDTIDTSRIVVVPNRVYTMTNTSTLADRSNGIVSGRYAMEASSLLVGFSIITFTDDDSNSYQFYQPTLTNTLLPTQLFERGTFTLQLSNQIGF